MLANCGSLVNVHGHVWSVIGVTIREYIKCVRYRENTAVGCYLICITDVDKQIFRVILLESNAVLKDVSTL